MNRYNKPATQGMDYRQGYEVGRHVIGYELQKIFAAIDWMRCAIEKRVKMSL